MAAPVTIVSDEGNSVTIEKAPSGREIWMGVEEDDRSGLVADILLHRNEVLQLIRALQTIYKEIDV
mgnify:CR=1 FL=1